jgi:hypothetical protein
MGRGRGRAHSNLATDRTKREMYDRLHQHLTRLADEVEAVMNGRETA